MPESAMQLGRMYFSMTLASLLYCCYYQDFIFFFHVSCWLWINTLKYHRATTKALQDGYWCGLSVKVYVCRQYMICKIPSIFSLFCAAIVGLFLRYLLDNGLINVKEDIGKQTFLDPAAASCFFRCVLFFFFSH